MTLTECIENHKKLWNWIADKSIERKRKVEKWEYFTENNLISPYCDCFLCEYNAQNVGYFKGCGMCPAKLKLNNTHKDCCNGLYFLWCVEFDYQKSADLARQIANCPLEDWAIEKLKEEEENGRCGVFERK